MPSESLETALATLRERRDLLTRKVADDRKVIEERMAALGPSGVTRRALPDNVRAELRWLEGEEEELRHLEHAVAALQRAAASRGDDGDPYRVGIRSVSDVVRSTRVERHDLARKIRAAEQRLVKEYVRAKVPAPGARSGRDDVIAVALLGASFVFATWYFGMPGALLATYFVAFVGSIALAGSLRARRSASARDVSLDSFDHERAPENLRVEKRAVDEDVMRLAALDEELIGLEEAVENRGSVEDTRRGLR